MRARALAYRSLSETNNMHKYILASLCVVEYKCVCVCLCARAACQTVSTICAIRDDCDCNAMCAARCASGSPPLVGASYVIIACVHALGPRRASLSTSNHFIAGHKNHI